MSRFTTIVKDSANALVFRYLLAFYAFILTDFGKVCEATRWFVMQLR